MTLLVWAGITAAFMIWAYWPRLMDRLHPDSEHREQHDTGDTDPY